ncbi:MAG TPA: tRNA lysidine(34) synthetase TilS [Clostridiales bacterium]|nr:tRNA lysidine(34) synthetase TilS [Clostridiales bacterium]
MDEFLKQVCTFIERKQLLPPGSPVIAGISGGADSMALLHVLDRLCEPLNLRLTVAHVNHQLRGESSDGDEEFVHIWCQAHGRTFVSHHVDVSRLASEMSIGLEEAGRVARYTFFNSLADQSDAMSGNGLPAVIALAHHLDDQAETILLHLGRGCGLDGLTGMPAKSGRLIRPLLEQSRVAIENWLLSQQLSWRHDATNDELFTLRNRLRSQVLPAWSAALGYSPATMLARTAQILDEDRRYLDLAAEAAARSCRRDDGWQVSLISAQPVALQSRILRRAWLEKTGSSKDLSFIHIQLILAWLPTAIDNQMLSLPGGWRVRIANGLIDFFTDNGNNPDNQTFQTNEKSSWQTVLALPSDADQVVTTEIPFLNLQITAELIVNDEQIVYNDTTEYFLLERIRGSTVRFRLPGDRIRQAGRKGSKTLKKFLNEQGIPPQNRGSMPLVASGQSVIWLPGLAAGEDYVARPGSQLDGPIVRLTVNVQAVCCHDSPDT